MSTVRLEFVAEMHQVSSGGRRSSLGPSGRGVLFEPAGEGAHEVLSADFSLPVLGLAAGGAGDSDVVGRLLEDNFRHDEWLRGGRGSERRERIKMVIIAL